MPATLYHTATELTANQLTFIRGSLDDVVTVGVYHNTDPGVIPEVADFTIVSVVEPDDPLGETGKIDVTALIGPRSGEASLILTAGVYQRWVLVTTAMEDIIRRPDTVTIT